MKRIFAGVAVCVFLFLADNAEAQNLKRFIKDKGGSTTEAAGDKLDDETDTVVVKGVSKGIDMLKSRFLGTSGSSDSSESAGEGKGSGEVENASNDSATGSGNEQTDSSAGSLSSGSSGSYGRSSSGSVLGSAFLGAMGMSGNVKTREQYEFDSYVQMQVSTFDSKGKLEESGNYDTYNSRESMSYAMIIFDDRDKSTIIFDPDNNVMLTLSESGGEKTGFAVAFNPDSLEEDMEAYAEEYEENPEDFAYKQYRTGRTKNIMGYKCDEYLIEDESSATHMWVTDALNRELQKDVMKNSLFGGMFLYAGYMNGMVLEYEFNDKESGEKVVMTVTDLDLNRKHTISTRGYNIFSMGSMPEE